jgi:hypothetical protein
MPTKNWLKEQLNAAREEIENWPEWKKKELDAENEHLNEAGADEETDSKIRKVS